MLVGFLVFVLVLGAWGMFLYSRANSLLQRVDALSTGADTPGTTYLIVGSDERGGDTWEDGTEGQRADTIMLLHQAPNGATALVSLPRDTLVEIPEYGWSKLNAAYAYGGAPLLVQTVEGLVGLHVDHYLQVGMGGLTRIVDAVGGVELCLDYDVDDPKSELVWQAGCHVADGPTALAFARMRYQDPEGDIGRARRQREVIAAISKNAARPGVFLNPKTTYDVATSFAGALSVDRETSLFDLASFAWAFKSVQGSGLTGAPPIEDPAYDAGAAGSAVLLVEDGYASTFFSQLREGTLQPESFNSAP